jgi:hypothetical protein
MAFDAVRYEREVLEPARSRGNELPADLDARYAITPELLRSPGALSKHVDAVTGHWRTLRRQRKYAKLADALLAAHARLGTIDAAAIEEHRRQSQKRLDERIGDLVALYSCISPDMLRGLAHETALAEGLVRAALRRRGVRVVGPVEVGERPPSAKYRDLRSNLRILGLRLSPEVVFGEEAVRAGFRVRDELALSARPHERLDAASIEAAQRRLDTQRHDDRKTAAANVLAILRAESERPGAVAALVRWEVAETLRQVTVRSQRALAREAVDLGLDEGEANALALSIMEASPAAARANVELEVRQALAEGRLREAQSLAATLTDPRAAPVLAAVEAAGRRVAELVETASRARAERRDEEAAKLLADALRVASDDETLRERLETIPPPPPSSVQQSVDGGRVIVSWRPSTVHVGAVRYRVVRRTDRPAIAAQDGVEVASTNANEVVDVGPPAGRPLYHSVFAGRDGPVWSAPASAGPVLVAPDVREPRLSSDGSVVTGAWECPEGASQVVVTRSEHAPPASSREGRPIRQVTLLGFTDRAVRPDVTYHYRIAAVYPGASGELHQAPGVVAAITPEPLLAPVTDLQVSVVPGRDPLTIRVTWTPPHRGMVSVRISPRQSPMPVGSVVPLTDLAALGRELSAPSAPAAGGRAGVTVTAGALRGRHFFHAITAGRSQAVIGSSVAVSLAAPVRDLVAHRFAGIVRLSWAWPDESTLARVRWRADGSDHQAECTRRRYHADGGFEIALGNGAATISVQAVVTQSDEQVAAVGMEVEVEALASIVRYHVRRPGILSRRRALVLEVDVPCRAPRLTLVARPGTLLPLRPDQGVVAAEFEGGPLEPGRPVAIEFVPPPGPARLWLFDAGSADAVTLEHPPAGELELR